MKTLFFVLVILSNGKIVNEDLMFISLEKCMEYETQINREASLITYNYSAYCRPEVMDTNEQVEE
tara:strand:+ start:227 stop:421 length:195 start_codon:yes stop_codon:yes gene_type:complete